MISQDDIDARMDIYGETEDEARSALYEHEFGADSSRDGLAEDQEICVRCGVACSTGVSASDGIVCIICFEDEDY